MTLSQLGVFLDSTAGMGVILACLTASLAAIRVPTRKWQDGRYTGGILAIAAIALVGFVFLLLSFWFPIRGEVSAAVIPRLWVAGLWACCLYLLVRTLRGREDPDAPARGLSLVFEFMGLSVGYLVLMYLVGYYLSTLLFLIAAIITLGYRRWLRLLAVAGGWVIFVYVVFFRLLYVPLPGGVLFRLLAR